MGWLFQQGSLSAQGPSYKTTGNLLDHFESNYLLLHPVGINLDCENTCTFGVVLKPLCGKR